MQKEQRPLIKLIEQDKDIFVDARELHEFLETETKFNDWIQRRIEKYAFQEDTDFTVPKKKHGEQERDASGKFALQNDYLLSLDMAKELCMIENNSKGRQARKYFLKCEAKLKDMNQNIKSLIHSAYVSGLMEGIYRNWTLPWDNSTEMLKRKVKQTLENLSLDINYQVEKYERDASYVNLEKEREALLEKDKAF